MSAPVDAVVCARGETAKTFVPVVRALRRGARGNVYLVDDGRNRGLWRARLAGARIVRGPRRGKAAAMRAGLSRVQTKRVIFADADLTGFTPRHAARLAEAERGQLAALRDNGSRWLGPVPPVTGERSLPADVARAALAGCDGYAAETALNAEVGRRGLPAATFTMTGCTNPSKAPLQRAVQVLAAVTRDVLGVLQYMAAWTLTALGLLAVA